MNLGHNDILTRLTRPTGIRGRNLQATQRRESRETTGSKLRDMNRFKSRCISMPRYRNLETPQQHIVPWRVSYRLKREEDGLSPADAETGKSSKAIYDRQGCLQGGPIILGIQQGISIQDLFLKGAYIDPLYLWCRLIKAIGSIARAKSPGKRGHPGLVHNTEKRMVKEQFSYVP